jgi:hypothetical protein
MNMDANILENLPQMGEDPAIQIQCTMQFLKLLSIKNPPIQQVI